MENDSYDTDLACPQGEDAPRRNERSLALNDPYELTGYEEHQRDSQYTGDPRRCPKHPSQATSSADGMFDAPCAHCEAEISEWAERWEYDADNHRRLYCALPIHIPMWDIRIRLVSCEAEPEDNIPF